MIVHAATACHAGQTYPEAVRRLQSGAAEPLFGTVVLAHCQLCPQNLGVLDETGLVMAIHTKQSALEARN